MKSFRLEGVPSDLEWRLDPVEWTVEDAARLSIRAGEKTDLFFDPALGARNDSAPAALFAPPDRDFILSARVKVDFRSTFDAGVLHARCGGDRWAKLCFEYSPDGQPMVVSVVNHGVSDDCNSVTVAARAVYLRIAQAAQATAFHYSLDGERWNLVRHFSLGSLDGLRTGFSSQSPTGGGCLSVFSEIRYRPGTLKDLRNGE